MAKVKLKEFTVFTKYATVGVTGTALYVFVDLLHIPVLAAAALSFILAGVEKSRGEYILFTDADNSTPIEAFEKFYPLLSHTKVVIGSRYMAESDVKIKQPKYRILLGRLGNFLIQVFLFDDIRDTQCGFKAFQHSAAKELFSRMKVNRFGFDIELLSIANLLKYSVREVPVSWYNSPVSRVRPIKDTLRTFTELLYIKLNLMSGRYE
jgi:dolichyl-phosphate beta-glucosyltransferase